MIKPTPAPREHDIQASCIRWMRLQYPREATMLFAIPNGAHLAAQRTARIVQMRTEQVKLPELGKQKMYFVEAEVEGRGGAPGRRRGRGMQ